MSNETVTIKAPAFRTAVFTVKGTAPLVINKFPQKAREMMRAKQAAGGQAKKGGKREAKDFDLCYEQAKHVSREGWLGIPASAFRRAMIDACRLVNFKMTLAKQAVFVLADGFDRDEGTPLVRITGGEPVVSEMPVRNETGVADIRVRPMWHEWACEVRVQFDADLFSAQDVANLLSRAGVQVGVQEGRPFSKNSAGMGWGTFEIVNNEEAK